MFDKNKHKLLKKLLLRKKICGKIVFVAALREWRDKEKSSLKTEQKK
jgi:hypothetical protein